MKQEDRNLFLIVGIVIIASIIAMIAIFSVIWGLVGGPVSTALNSISRFIQLQNLDYKFPVPRE